MTPDPKWRARVRAGLEAYFRRRSFPRLTLSLLLSVTGASGFFLSDGMLHAGLDHMWLRYPIAVALSYLILLGLIRLWVQIEWTRFEASEAELEQWPNESTELVLSTRLDRTSSWFDWLDVPDVSLGDLDEGCLPMILVLVLFALASVLALTLAGAPMLIAEVFLDAFIVTALYRRLRMAQKEHWLGTALRKTWLSVLVTALALAAGGWVLEQMAPGARSIGRAIEQIQSGHP